MRLFNKYITVFAWAAAAVMLMSGTVYAVPSDSEKPQDTMISTENMSDDIFEPLPEESKPAATSADLQISSKSAILIEQKTGNIIYEKNAHEKLSPASVTKVMSLLLITEAIDRGDISLDTEITASEHASEMGGSQIWLKVGEVMTVDDLLKATVIASANDATVALAEAVSGSEEVFVAEMNERAAQLGMNDTVFKNCTGLDAEGHVTSAYDISVMSRELLRHDIIRNYSTVWMDTLRGGKSQLVNTNKLVRFYEGTIGLKTGTTSKAGYCLSAAAERDGTVFIAVVMDAPSSKERFAEARSLLSYGFANFTFRSFSVPSEELTDIKVKGGTAEKVSVRAAGDCEFLLEKVNADRITHITELDEEIAAPVEEGEQVGMCRIFSGDEEIGTVKIVASSSVEKMSFLKAFLRLLGQMAVV